MKNSLVIIIRIIVQDWPCVQKHIGVNTAQLHKYVISQKGGNSYLSTSRKVSFFDPTSTMYFLAEAVHDEVKYVFFLPEDLSD